MTLPVPVQRVGHSRWHAVDEPGRASCGVTLPAGQVQDGYSVHVVDELCRRCFDVDQLRSDLLVHLRGEDLASAFTNWWPDGTVMATRALVVIERVIAALPNSPGPDGRLWISFADQRRLVDDYRSALRRRGWSPLAGHRYWTVLHGTSWQVLDSSMDRSLPRAYAALDTEGAVLRPATGPEVATWQELQDTMAKLRAARTAEDRLGVLATETIHIEQPPLL